MESTLEARIERAKQKIIAACKEEDVDLVAIVEQRGAPQVAEITIGAALSFLDLKPKPSLVVPGSENMAN